MPHSPPKRDSTPVAVSSSSENETTSEDEYWMTSSERRRKNVPGISKVKVSRGATPQPNRFPAREALTPQKGAKTPAGTPTSRNFAIEEAFKRLEVQPIPHVTTPSPNKTDQKRKVIVIESDSEDDNLVPTDDEPTSSPTRPSSHKRPVLTDSSQSSMGSLFSPPVSATSSFSSVGSAAPQPVHIADIFTTASPDVTPRRAPKVFLSKFVPSVPRTASSPVASPERVSREEVSEAVIDFARGPLCADLEQYIIAHDDKTQTLMDRNAIAWATQFELARGVLNGSWSWDEVQANITKLQGTTENSAFKIQPVMKNLAPPESVDLTMWKEFDREEAAIMENKGRGLGLMGDWKGVKDWYGGQIQQLARLQKDSFGKFKVILEPLEKRRSHRYGRFYGSRRFIQLRVPEEFLQKDAEKVPQFLSKKFVLCGRVFYPFCSKEGSIYLVESDENQGRASGEWCGDQFRMSFRDFVNWHNPIEESKNHRQTKSKYATRFALGLSNSVPALQFEKENIHFIPDITADDWPKDKKNPPADKLMTDGCGLINHAALHAIVKQMGYESLPAGVQGRIAGGKGFWILHPTDESPEPKIWIRNSQNKIHYENLDRAHCIFDLLAPSRASPPIALTQQSIMNLFHNGIPAETLVRRMEQGLEEEVAPLLDWDKPNGMVFLWDAINKAGNVSGTRTQRVSLALNRALGLKGRDWGRDDDAEPNGSEDDKTSTVYTGRNIHSGAPLALHEVALELVQAGFHPGQSKLLNNKIGYIVQNVIKASVEKYRIPILESLGAFIVPDPLGILEEGEISYRFSKPRKDPRTEMLVHALTGDLVVGRYPMRLPSDMQKVTAVDKRELDKWPDVFIISTKGFASLASLLAGGDTDGDEIIAISDPEIVGPFENKQLIKEPPDLIGDSFESNAKVESLEIFCLGAKNCSSRDTSEGFMKTLIGNLSDSQVGLYSMMHESAVVTLGYDHPESIRLAYIFSTLLDASKTGHRLLPGIKERDLRKYGKGQRDELPTTQWDILRILKNAATRKGEELMRKYESKKVPGNNQSDKGGSDQDLLAPYLRACDRANRLKDEHKIVAGLDELTRIRKQVYAAQDLFLSACASSKNQTSPSKKGSKFGKPKKDDPMLAAARAYAVPINDTLLIDNAEDVKASFAYTVRESFAFSVAFQQLCHMKATACAGGHAPTLRIFDEAKSVSGSFLRALKACDEQR